MVKVTGRVQGVYYRAFTREQAQALGVCGWVSNQPDGSVTALLQHPDAMVLARLLAAMQQGPPSAMVEGVSYEPVEEDRVYSEFTIER
jgi:acylphosphatase